MKRLLIATVIGVVLGAGGGAFAQSAEERAELQRAISATNAQISTARAEDAKHKGGLVKALIQSRIAILEQTKAMLDQRAHASTFGIALRYTVDGKPFTLPLDPAPQLTSVEADLTTLRANIAKQEAEAARYSGGLSQAMALSTVATSRQTEAMLEQKRLAIRYSLPQYFWLSGSSQAASPAPTRVAAPTPNEQAPPPTETDPYRIVAVEAMVTERNDTWWRYSWKVTLHNNTERSLVFRATIEFQDKDGLVIDSRPSDTIGIPGNSDDTATGYALVRMPKAQNVARTMAKVSLVR